MTLALRAEHLAGEKYLNEAALLGQVDQVRRHRQLTIGEIHSYVMDAAAA